VLTEYLTFFCASPEYLRREVASNVEAILHDPTVRVIEQSHESFAAGFELYRARPDKGYSLTDCISMRTMRKEGLTDALTTGISSRKVFERCFGFLKSRSAQLRDVRTVFHCGQEVLPFLAPPRLCAILLVLLQAGRRPEKQLEPEFTRVNCDPRHGLRDPESTSMIALAYKSRA
jgi:hypothetical protein